MKVLRFLSACVLLLAFTLQAYATEASIGCTNIEATGGQQVELPIFVKNSDDLTVVGISFTLKLPEGVTLMTDEEGEPLYELVNSRLNTRRFFVTAAQQTDGSWGFRISTNNATAALAGTEGTVMTVTLAVGANMSNGNYTIKLTDNKLSVRDEGNSVQTLPLADSNATLTIGGGEPVEPVVVTAQSYTREYGDANPTFEYTVAGGELVGTPEITCTASATSPVGTYDIVISKGSVTNGDISFVNGTLTITKAPLTIKAGTYTRKQGEENPEFTLTYEGFKNGETKSVLTQQPTVTCEATTTSPVGDYPVKVSGAAAQNYEISYVNGTLKVTAADPIASDNVIGCYNVEAVSGQQVELPIFVKNKEDLTVVGISFTLKLPEGVTLMTDEEGEPLYELVNSRLNTRRFFVTAAQQTDGSWGFRISTNNATAALAGTEGTVMTVTLAVGANMSNGNYTIKLIDNKLSVRDEGNSVESLPLADSSATLTIGAFTTLELKDGWNWVSVNVSDDWSASKFLEPIKNDAERMLSQTQELVNDPVYNLVGNLKTLSPAEGYKLKMSADASLTLKGEAADIGTTIALKKGWNWIGYLPTKALALETALSGLLASDGDRIVSQDGFAEYKNGVWSSSFDTMEPGKGYMYQSAKDVTFSYPSNATAARSAITCVRAAEQQSECPWEYDVHRYPDVTTIISLPISLPQPLQKESLPQPLQKEGGDIAVAAFCGEECRGVGRWVGDKLFITVHGTSGLNESISFRAYDPSTGEELPIVETITFQGQSVGSLSSPLLLHMQESNGIEERHSAVVASRYYALSGRKLQRPQKGVNIVAGKDGRKILVK